MSRRRRRQARREQIASTGSPLRDMSQAVDHEAFGSIASFLGGNPLVPSSLRSDLGKDTRMYARIEAMAWVEEAQRWLQEAHLLLADSADALARAADQYGTGFPPLSKDWRPPPYVLTVSAAPKDPLEYLGDVKHMGRAREFFYHLNNAVFRISASFHKVVGLLGTYYELRYPKRKSQLHRDSEFFRALTARFVLDHDVGTMVAITEANAFTRGQEYRNPFVHEIGSSFTALYGGPQEVGQAQVFGPGLVGVGPLPRMSAEELYELGADFLESALRFSLAAFSLVRAHPSPYVVDTEFLPRVIQRPSLHRGVDGRTPIDFTDTFSPTDKAIYCTFIVINGVGHDLRVRWRVGNVSHDERIGVPNNELSNVTVYMTKDEDEQWPVGRHRIDFLDSANVAWTRYFNVTG